MIGLDNIRIVVNPENPTEIWGTYDGRKPTEEDHDFGADFSFNPDEQQDVADCAARICDLFNAAQKSALSHTIRRR